MGRASRALIDLLPIAAFFIGYQYGGIFFATGAIMAGMAVQLLLIRLTGRSIEGPYLAGFVLVLLFGTLTLVLRDGAFIQWKTTVINLGFAAALVVSHKLLSRNLVRMALSKVMTMSDADWGTFSHLLALSFLFMAALNTALVLLISEETWVTIKTFGYPVLSLALFVLIFLYAARRATMVGDDAKE